MKYFNANVYNACVCIRDVLVLTVYLSKKLPGNIRQLLKVKFRGRFRVST